MRQASPRVMWLTNDLPPAAGGIQRFVGELLARSDPATTLVLGPRLPRSAGGETQLDCRIERWRGAVVPRPAVGRWAVTQARAHDAEVVVLGAAWPLGELAAGLRRRLGIPVVALSHGLEAGLVQLGVGRLLARATRDVALLTAITEWTETRIAAHARAERVARLPPGVDTDRYRVAPERRRSVRQQWQIPEDAPVVGCVSRLVRRKGQDLLLDVWPRVRRRHPDAWLLIVGGGPLESRLARHASVRDPAGQVVMVGEASWAELPGYYAAMDLFAMPCRTRWGGLDVEGLGIVFLEAQACGVPVIAGTSGGAPEALLEGQTGEAIDGRDPDALLESIDRWLGCESRRRTAAHVGPLWVRDNWGWPSISRRFQELLADVTDAR